MKHLNRLLLECELDGDALVAKLHRAARLAEVYDGPTCSQITDMAVWLTDVCDDLSRLRGAPRDVPDYHDEVRA